MLGPFEIKKRKITWTLTTNTLNKLDIFMTSAELIGNLKIHLIVLLYFFFLFSSSSNIYSRPWPGAALQRPLSLINYVSHLLCNTLPPLALRRRQAWLVKDGAYSYKIYYVAQVCVNLNHKCYKNSSLVKQLQPSCRMSGFCLLVELYQEESASSVRSRLV